MFSLNEVSLLGRLGSDATVRTASNGSKFATFSLATEEAVKGADGQWSYKTTWHNLCAWGPEGIFPKLTKGITVLVRGNICYRQDQSGKNLMDIRVRQIMVQQAAKSDGGCQQGGRQQTYGNRQNGWQKQQPAQQQQQQYSFSEVEDYV